MSASTPATRMRGSTGPRAQDAPRRAAREPNDDRRLVRVWELPVRITHWTIVAAVIVLSVTGFYIGTPIVQSGSESAFLMGKVRAVHIVSGWTLIAALGARIAWMFMGNEWARWRQFIPTTRERRQGARESLRYYLFVRREPPRVVGHNPLAGLTYAVVYTMLLVQALTGVALAGLASRDGVLWWLTGWVFDLFTIPTVRLVHHMIMWLTLGFLVHHVYSAVLVDTEERSGIISSIITGWKRVPKDDS